MSAWDRGSKGRGNSKSRSTWSRGRWRGRGSSRVSHYHSRQSSQQSSVSSTPASTSSLHDLARCPNPIPRFLSTTPLANCVYKGWHLYFPNDTYDEHSDITTKVKLMERYISKLNLQNRLEDIEESRHLNINYKQIISDSVIEDEWRDLSTELVENPHTVLSIMGLSIYQVLTELKRQAFEKRLRTYVVNLPENDFMYTPKIYARLHNLDITTHLKNLKANCYGKFISVKGTVVRVSNIKPMCTQMAFECNSCGELMCLEMIDGKYSVPVRCPSTECRGRTFIPLRSSPSTQTVDWQTIRLQECNNEEDTERGRIPRTVDCELTDHLVDCCVPGDVVSVCGVVKVNAADEGHGGKGKDKCLFLLYIHANSVVNNQGQKAGASGSGLAMDFSMNELYAVREIQAETQLFRLLVASLCPTICGHEMVKAGLILALFGSHRKFANDKNRVPVRGDLHVLIVGDPGLGKSQMLQAVCNIAPRSVYVCGNTSTTAGLTVTVCKEGSGNDHSLEAGALVLADQGCCCIDEFDKMSAQHQALLEAMEQQSISIAKAGIVCSLPARTAIIAAANPIGGHYNKAKTVSENLKLGSALLSRFDLVFILLDKPDEEMDSMLSTHVMALHTRTHGGHAASITSDTLENKKLNENIHGDDQLCRRLKVHGGRDNIDLIPHALLRKYIGYARKYVQSRISPEAAQLLQSFYMELRQRHHTRDSTPITTRQLESLIRLTEARARLELREVATEGDARDVVELMKYSMSDTYSDEFGQMDFKRSQHGSGMSGRSRPKRFISALQRVTERTSNSIFTVAQMKQIAKEINVAVTDFESFIMSLNDHGFLLKKGPRVYQLQTSDY